MTDLQSLTRKELQALAKKHGIRANQKTSVIVEQLTSKLAQDAPQQQEEQEPSANVAPVTDTVDESTVLDFSESFVMTASRKELQALCKQNGIRANQKTTSLQQELVKLLDASAAKPQLNLNTQQQQDAVAEEEKVQEEQEQEQGQEQEQEQEQGQNSSNNSAPVVAKGTVEGSKLAEESLTETPMAPAATETFKAPCPTQSNNLEAQSAAQPQSTQSTSMTADMARIVLTSMLRSHAPDKLANVDELLRLNVGKEEELLQRVAAKYRIGLKPSGNASTASRTGTGTGTTVVRKNVAGTTGLAGRVPPAKSGSASKQRPVEHFSRRSTPGSATTKNMMASRPPVARSSGSKPVRPFNRPAFGAAAPRSVGAKPTKRKLLQNSAPSSRGPSPAAAPAKRGRIVPSSGNNEKKSRPGATSLRAGPPRPPTKPIIRGGGAVTQRRLSARLNGGARGATKPMAGSSSVKAGLSVRSVNAQQPSSVDGKTAKKPRLCHSSQKSSTKKARKSINWDAIHRRDEARNLRNTETLWQRQERLKAERQKLLQ